MSNLDDLDGNGGCGAMLFLLAVVFVVLKLAGAITWSWWLVLLPLWIVPAIGVALVVGMLAIVMLVVLAIIAVLVGIELAERRRRR